MATAVDPAPSRAVQAEPKGPQDPLDGKPMGWVRMGDLVTVSSVTILQMVPQTDLHGKHG